MKIIIYGAGERGIHALNRIRKTYADTIEIVGFIDTKRTGDYCGFPIWDIDDAPIWNIENDVQVVIALATRKTIREVYQYFWEKGKVINYYYLAKDSDNYKGEDFFSYECGKLYGDPEQIIPHIEIHAVDHCNLNCAGCVHFSPICQDTIPNTARRIEDIGKIRSISNNILSMFIMGGEPLLNPDLILYLEEARRQLPASDIQLVTNGLLIPLISDKLLTTIHMNKITVAISEYEPTYHLRGKIVKRLREYEIDYMIRPYDKKQKFNKPLTVSSNTKHKNICISDGCVNINEGKIARCPTLMYIKDLNDRFGFHFPTEGIYNLEDVHSCEELNSMMQENVPLCRYCIKNEIDWHRCSINPCAEDFVVYD